MTRHGMWYDLIKPILNVIIKYGGEKLVITKTASEWLFDGFSDTLLSLLKKANFPVPYNKFAWFYARNLSAPYDGIFKMNTGVDNIYKLGNIVEWDHMRKTNYFKGDCAIVNGTSGEIFPPMKDLQETASIFVPDVCR